MSEAYTIRTFEGDDTSGWLDLFELVHGARKTREWFEWKYIDNPAVDHIPIVVAEHDDEIVGARPSVLLPMRDESWRGRAAQAADAMVHPEHRRQGVFSAMIERTTDRYTDRNVGFCYSFPNALSGAAYRKMGWEVVDRMEEQYRFHRPAGIIRARTGLPAPAMLGRLGEVTLRGLETIACVGLPRPAGVRTEIRSELPAELLHELYRRRRPDRLHTERDPALLRWRFANPDWRYTTFLGWVDGTLAAAVVVATRENDGGWRLTRVADVLPLEGGRRWRTTVEMLLRDVIAAYDDSHLFALPDSPVPRELGRRLGFLPDDQFPLSMVTERTDLIVNHIDDGIPASRLFDPNAWTVTFVEYDTA